MDYISFPETVIYRERERLEDFDVKNTKSLNFILESELHKLYYTWPGYKNFALKILNTAYYICTMVKADDDPTRNFGDYLSIIEEKMHRQKDQVALVLSMVLIIIVAYKWNETKTDLGTFALQVFYEIEKHNHIRYAYYEPAKNHFEFRADRTTLSPDSEFTRRPINYRLLADNYSVEDLRNLFGTDEQKVYNFIDSLGKDEEEQYTIASFLEDQMHSFFSDGWRHKAFFNSVKSHIHKTFHGEEERAEMDAQIEEDLMKEYEQQGELDYYKDEYQKQKDEIATLRAEIEKIKREVKDVDDRHRITPEQFYAIFSDENIQSKNENDSKEVTEIKRLEYELDEAKKTINEQQAELKRLNTLNEVLTKQNTRYEEENPEMDIDEDTALGIKESIIFFSSIMDCNLSKEDISQMNFARLISKITKWPRESIRTQIVDINTERENNTNNHTAFSDGVHQAAVNVCALIENAMAGLKKNSLPYSCKQAVENILKIYNSPGRKIEPHEIAEAKKILKKI